MRQFERQTIVTKLNGNIDSFCCNQFLNWRFSWTSNNIVCGRNRTISSAEWEWKLIDKFIKIQQSVVLLLKYTHSLSLSPSCGWVCLSERNKIYTSHFPLQFSSKGFHSHIHIRLFTFFFLLNSSKILHRSCKKHGMKIKKNVKKTKRMAIGINGTIANIKVKRDTVEQESWVKYLREYYKWRREMWKRR